MAVEKRWCWHRVWGLSRGLGFLSARDTHTQTDTALPMGPKPTSWGWTDAGDRQEPSQRGAAASLGVRLALRALLGTASGRALG